MRAAYDEFGNEVIFYTLGALAEAVGKKPVTIKQWLAKHYIPEPSWRSPRNSSNFGGAGVRLWTKEQIEAIMQIAKEEGVIVTEFGAKKAGDMAKTNFPARVFALWERMKW